MNAIEIDRLSYRYPDGTAALREVTFSVKKNARLAILGANGSGKTTLMMHLNGLFLPQSGSVRVLGEPVQKDNVRRIRSLVGMLFDSPDNQLFSTSVYEDIAFGPFNMDCSEEDIAARTKAAIAAVGLEELAARPPHNLSLGQKKKAAIAGLLSMRPALFVMDEPFSGLDPEAADGFSQVLDDLHKDGATIVMSTHDVDFTYRWADQVAVMQGGRLAAFGEPDILEDNALCEQWNLQLPTLYRAFAGTPYRPKTPDEAARCLAQLMQQAGLSHKIK